MEYNPESLKMRETPKAGSRCDAIVEKIEAGTLGDFVAPDALAKWNGAKTTDTAIRVIARTTDGFERKKTMPIDPTGAVHPKSNLAKWNAAYGGFPKEGQQIFMIADSEGYWQFFV